MLSSQSCQKISNAKDQCLPPSANTTWSKWKNCCRDQLRLGPLRQSLTKRADSSTMTLSGRAREVKVPVPNNSQLAAQPEICGTSSQIGLSSSARVKFSWLRPKTGNEAGLLGTTVNDAMAITSWIPSTLLCKR